MEARVPLKVFRRSPAPFRETRCFVLKAVCAAVLGLGRPAAAAEPTKDQCIDANEAAQTLVHSARLRAAKRKLQVCVATSCPGPVREDCAQQMNQIELKIPTIVFEAKDENNRDLSAVRVTMDGQPLVETLEGTAIPLDPGSHTFVFHSEGRGEQTWTLVLHEGEKDRHERLVLKVAAAGGRAAGNTAPANTAPGNSVPSNSVPSNSVLDNPDRYNVVGGGAQIGPESAAKSERAIALALGGAGAAGVIVGAVFGIVAKSTYDDALQKKCHNDPHQCSPDGLSERGSAQDQATVSTVAFVVGPALLAAGIYIYFFGPKAHSVSVAPTVGTAGAGLSMRGWW
jgi:hypothetical protein